jgi:hypothetical protein
MNNLETSPWLGAQSPLQYNYLGKAPLERLERSPPAPEAGALSAELQGLPISYFVYRVGYKVWLRFRRRSLEEGLQQCWGNQRGKEAHRHCSAKQLACHVSGS